MELPLEVLWGAWWPCEALFKQVVHTNGVLFGDFLCIGRVDFSSKCCKQRSGLFHVCFAVLAMGGTRALSPPSLKTTRAVGARSQLNSGPCAL